MKKRKYRMIVWRGRRYKLRRVLIEPDGEDIALQGRTWGEFVDKRGVLRRIIISPEYGYL